MTDTTHYDIARYRLWTNDHVRFCDLDALGHVNNNSMGMYFENARAALFAIITPEWPWRDHIFVLVRTSIDFSHELHLPARLKIGTCITRVGNTSMNMANALFHGDTPIAYSESVSVLIDRAQRTPVPLSDELKKAMEPFIDGTL